jgi:hypothetical protein
MEELHPAGTIEVYHDFQDKYAAEISTDEAIAAERAFSKGQTALAWVAASWMAIVLLASFLEQHLLLAAVLSDIAQALVIIASLVLVTLYRVPFAGRLLIPLGMFEVALEVPSSSWDDTEVIAGGAFFLFFILWCFGWMIDGGASPERHPRHPRLPAALLLAFSVLFSGVAVFLWSEYGRDEGHPFPFGVILASAVCALWPWLNSWFEKRRPHLDPDAKMVHQVAVRRWLSRFFGRLLAVVFAVFPLFLFLNNLDLVEKLRVPSETSVLETPGALGGPRTLWYWPTAPKDKGKRVEGRFLQLEDFKKARIYGLSKSRVGEAKLNEIESAIANLSGEPEKAELLTKLESSLKPYRIGSDNAFQALWVDRPASDDDVVLYQLGTGRARPSLGKPKGVDVNFVQENPFETVTRSEIQRLIAERYLVGGFLAVCGALGFLLLWRRGGDSPTARWLSLWVVGWAVAIASPYARFYLPTVVYNLWQIALHSPIGGIFLTALSTLESLADVNAFFAFVPLPFAALWVHLCWPVKPTLSRWTWRQRGAFAVKTIVILGILCMAFLVSAALGLWGSDEIIWRWGLIGFTLVAIGLGWLARRKTAARSEIPVLGALPVVAFLCFQAAVVFDDLLDELLGMANRGELNKAAQWESFSNLGLVSICAFAAICLWLILRRDFLSLSTGWDFSRILLLAILPLLFELSEDLAGHLLEATSFFSDSGQTVLGLVIVIALLGPVEKILQRLVLRLAMPRLFAIERAVENALEAIVDAPGDAEVREAAVSVFQELEIGEYLFYGRRENGALHLLVGTRDPAPQKIPLSKRLRSHLVHRCGSVLDLHNVPLHWRHFFQQFELARLEQATGCRYLLPVCFGNSLRALVLLPGVLDGHPVCRDLAGAEVGKLGVVVAETGRQRAAVTAGTATAISGQVPEEGLSAAYP